MNFESGLDFAKSLDEKDPLKDFRQEFHFPKTKTGDDCIYFTGNSLGLMPKGAEVLIQQDLKDWAEMGVEGHKLAKRPWMPAHEYVTESLAKVVGAKPIEVVAMNSLTVNLNLMMVSFYRPTKDRHKILIVGNEFPSDIYAVQAQIKFHGYDPEASIVTLDPELGEHTLSKEKISQTIKQQGSQIALILIGNVNYKTGQAFDVAQITKEGHEQGCVVGFDFAHGVGNLKLNLHNDNVDFAIWCNYKYMNSGPGAIAGCFVHERHANNFDLPRFCGWWGQDKKSRFLMEPKFVAIPGAEGWQISNPPIFQLASLRASLDLFDKAGMEALCDKRDQITAYLEFLIEALPNNPVEIITPKDKTQRACQLSLFLKDRDQAKKLQENLLQSGVISDFREPGIVRAAPAPFYTRYEDVYRFVEILRDLN